MEDKMLMEGLLWDTKVMADLCLHGTIESSTESIHKTFLTGLKDILAMQNDIYMLMSKEGWYSSQNVSETKISDTKFQQLVKQED